jgi:C4-dicarboxylate-binding protein DctP
MNEVQKYMTMTNNGYIGYVVVVNKKFWEGLPADIRGQLEKAMHDATVYGNEVSKAENEEALEAIKKAGTTQIITPTAAENEAMRKAMLPVYNEMANRLGKGIIEEFQKEANGATN